MSCQYRYSRKYRNLAVAAGGRGAGGREHTMCSITASIARAREVLGYAPRYTPLDALREALAWLVANDQADVGGQDFR